MSKTVISVKNLGKKYRLGATVSADTLRDHIMHTAGRLFGRGNGKMRHVKEDDEIWALKDVSFDVNQGEVLGVIGPNGSGKSTLLKILTGITEPTEGEVRMEGRVGSLLEVGTGFHKELTGRENIYMNGAILGMTRAEIKTKFDEIIAFAGTEKFLDTPVKRYSSGMRVRLGFAVAAHLEPEILLIDEVLAVGDVVFQKKCLGKMDAVAKCGRTVLFVSHNMVALQSLCSRAILLNDGKVIDEGRTDRVVSGYLNTSMSTLITEHVWDDMAIAPGNDQVRLHRLSVRPENGTPKDSITIRAPIALEFKFWNLVPGARLSLSLHLINETGVLVFNTFPVDELGWCGREFPAGLFQSTCHVDGDLLNEGKYKILLMVVKDQASTIYKMESALSFEVLDDSARRGDWHGKWNGVVRPNLRWDSKCLQRGLQ